VSGEKIVFFKIERVLLKREQAPVELCMQDGVNHVHDCVDTRSHPGAENAKMPKVDKGFARASRVTRCDEGFKTPQFFYGVEF